MSDQPQPIPAYQDQQQKKRRGCLFYGCLGAALLSILLVVGIVFGLKYAIQKGVSQFTAATPMELPAPKLGTNDLPAIQQKIKAFEKGMAGGEKSEPLELNSEELNALIAYDPAFKDWRDRVRIDLEGSQGQVRFSLPLDQFSTGFLQRNLKGRYLNGSARVKVSLDGGMFHVQVLSLQVKDQELPGPTVTQLQQSLVPHLETELRRTKTFDKLQDVAIRDGELVLVPK